MVNSICRYRQAIALLSLLVLCLAASGIAVAQNLPAKETELNGVKIGSSFREVLAKRGAPHYLGPIVGGMTEVVDILDPLPPPPMSMPEPKNPWQDKYVIWMYEGNGTKPNQKAGWNTFVFFDQRGVVVGVMVALQNTAARPPVMTSTGITFGSLLAEVVGTYDWPDPFIRIQSHYFCSYPEMNVTFSFDNLTSRRVSAICVGKPSVAAIYQPKVEASSGVGPDGQPLPGGPGMPPGGMPPGMLPGMPGMPPYDNGGPGGPGMTNPKLPAPKIPMPPLN